MVAMTVTSKGQVTIPRAMRKDLGIRRGSWIEFSRVDDHLEMRVIHTPSRPTTSGYGLLKSRRVAAPVGFDPAVLLKS